MRFIALDPSVDDMDGSAAVLVDITTVAETGVSLPASVTAAWYPAMGFREDEIALRIAFFNGRSGDPNLMTIDLTGAVIDPATVVVVDPVETEPREYTRPRATKNGKMAVKGRVFIYPDSSRIMMRITGRVPDSGTGSCGLVGLELLLVFPFLAKRRKKRSGSII